MPAWLEFVVGYAVYLTAVAWSDRRFLRARLPALTVLGASLAVGIAWPRIEAGPAPFPVVAWVAVPGLFVLATYRVSARVFVTPNLPLERWLLRVDATTLIDTGLLRARPRQGDALDLRAALPAGVRDGAGGRGGAGHCGTSRVAAAATGRSSSPPS